MTEMFLGLSPDTDKCDPELIGERIEDIEGYVASLQPGESFFENGDGLIVRANVEVNDDGDGVNHRVVGVVREEEGNDKKGWLVAAKGGHIFVVRELVDNKDYGDDEEKAYLLFSSKVDTSQFADCSNCDSLEQLAKSLALVSGIDRPSRNPFAVEKNSQ